MSPIRHTPLRAAVIAALVLPLAACAAEPSTPTAAPTPQASVTATPAAEPADPLADVVEAVLRPDAIELRGADDAVVAEVDYMGDPAEALATLTTVFDAEPVSEPIEGDLHFPDSVQHSWAGISVLETRYDEAERVSADLDNLLWPRLIALVDAPEVNGVVISSSAGGVGDRVDELAVPVDPALWTCSGFAVETVEVARASGATNTVGVSLTFSGAAGQRETPPSADETVTRLRAPADVAEGCV